MHLLHRPQGWKVSISILIIVLSVAFPMIIFRTTVWSQVFIVFLKLILCRWDLSKPEDYYHHVDRRRTLDNNCCMADKSSGNYGCIRKPLLNIPIANVRIDELHLLLRITGWYLVNLIKINPLSCIAPWCALLYYFTLSNAIRFYLSRGERWRLMG